MSEAPLTGLEVLDLTRLLPGGYATLLLADLGADVVKVEEPGRGDYVRWSSPMVGEVASAHVALNRNKRSMTLNLKSERGRDLFVRLAERFDVVIESFRPGVMARLGVGYERLRAANPALVYCAITGYGQDGPRANTAGHDVNYMSYAGALSIMGEEGGRPLIPGLQIGDVAGGGMAAVVAVLAALHRRAATGEGEFCDVAMTDGIVSWLSIHAGAFFATGRVPERGRMPLSGAYPCYRLYPASDGWISVGALEPQFWAVLCEALGRPDLAGDAYATGERRAHVIDELEELFSTRSRAEWMTELEGLDVCVAPVLDLAEAFEDEQLRQRRMVFYDDVPGAGVLHHVGNPLKLKGAVRESLRLPPPGLGEHTEEVLAEIGIERSSVEDLRATGVI